MTRRRRFAASLLAVLALCASAPGTRASDDAETTPLTALSDARDLIVQEKWSAALAALRAVLEDHRGDPRLLGELAQIEYDLQLTRFRSLNRKLKPAHLIGEGTTKLSTSSWAAEFKFDALAGPLWRSSGTSQVLIPPLRPPISIVMKASGVSEGRRITSVLLQSMRSQTEGVILSPGCFSSGNDSTLGTTAPAEISVKAKIMHVQPGKDAVVAEKFPMAYGSYPSKMTITADGDRVAIKCEGSTLRADADVGLAQISISAGDATDIRIKGRLDEDWGERAVAGAWDRALDDWIAKKYDRAKGLPDWAREALERQERAELPGGFHDEVEAQLALARTVEPVTRDESGADRAAKPESVQAYFAGLAAVGERRFGAAEDALGEALRDEPRLDDALSWRSWVRVKLRRFGGAAEDAAAVGDRLPASAPLILARARLAVHNGDLTTAIDVLEAAESAGFTGGRSDALVACVRRILEGHGFERPEGAIAGRYRVIGEVAEALCTEIAGALEAAHADYAALAGPLPEGTPRCTAYVFATDDRRKRFSDGLDEAHGAGGVVYLADVPTILITSDDEPGDRIADLREIGWREHLDRLVDAAPAWLSEGGAELIRDGDPAQARPNAALDPRSFVPTAELLRADVSEVGPGSPLRAQSRELMRFLATHDDPALRGLPAAVIAALAEGAAWPDPLTEGALAPTLARAADAFDATR